MLERNDSILKHSRNSNDFLDIIRQVIPSVITITLFIYTPMFCISKWEKNGQDSSGLPGAIDYQAHEIWYVENNHE